MDKLRIWQQNVNTSRFAHADLMNGICPDDWELIAFQEPAIRPDKNAYEITSSWISVYPTNHLRDGQERTRSLLLVNRKISTNAWKALPINSPDVTAIEMQTSRGRVQIINVYNDGAKDDTLELLDAHLANLTRDTNVVLLGDFNRHHPLWDEPRNQHLFTAERLEAAEKLIELTGTHGLLMTLPAGMPTHELATTKNYSRLDNVFISERLADHVDLCTAHDSPRVPVTDHFTIHTVIDLTCEKAKTHTRYNFHKTNWESFTEALRPRTDALPTGQITSVREFEERLKRLMDALKTTIEEEVPKIQQSPQTKRWWNDRLKELRAKRNELSNRSKRLPENHPIHAQYRNVHAEYQAELKKAREECWNHFIDTADGDDLWTAHKYLTSPISDGGATRTPTLATEGPDGRRIEHNTNTEKGHAFYEAFFPVPDQREAPDDADYPGDVERFRRVTATQLRRVIAKLKPYKAPGPDGIPNCVYIRCADQLVPILVPLYRATFSLEHYPQAWRESTTVVLRKPGKPDYSKPKAYRPIALLNVISKLLSACVAEELNRIAEQWNLLPEHHFGGRRGRTTTDSMHTLTSYVKSAWRAGEVVAGLFLDVAGAFPSASTTMLVHSMRMKGVPEEYVTWAERKLRGRTTTLRFDDYESDQFEIRHGVDQGCPLSCIFYLFYNSGLLQIARKPRGRAKRTELAVGYVDDVALLARAKTMEAATEKLKDMMEREGGALEWARDFTCEFALDKTALVGFTRVKEKRARDGGVKVKSAEYHCFLGVLFDVELRWREQRAKVLQMASQWANLLRRVCRIQHGLRPEAARRLHQSVFLPKVTYAADIWWEYVRRNATDTRDLGAAGFTKRLQSVQRISALNITGALRTSPTDALDAHAGILPIRLELQRACHRAALRLASVPGTHPLRALVDKEGRKIPAKHKSPLHILFATTGIRVESIRPSEPSPALPEILKKLRVAIAEDRETAIREEGEDGAEVRVYTDGSMKDGGVGAAAVLVRQGAETRTLKVYLGSDREHEVYEAEVVGLQLGLRLLETERRRMKSASIYTDNQAVLRTIQAGTTKQLSYMFADLGLLADKVHRRHKKIKITTRWIPGHEGVDGNEQADEEARNAGEGNSSREGDLPKTLRRPVPVNPTAAKRTQRTTLLKRWRDDFGETPRRERMERLDPTFPSLSFFDSARGLPRHSMATLVQMRLEHFPVAAYLYRFKRAESPTCPHCGIRAETVFHMLMGCIAHARARAERDRALGAASRSYRALLTPGPATPHVMRFLEEIGKLKSAGRGEARRGLEGNEAAR